MIDTIAARKGAGNRAFSIEASLLGEGKVPQEDNVCKPT